jgi:uncharacterized protein (TIGR03086 family)
MELTKLVRRAMQEFDGRVRAVGEDQWTLPTPCTEWDVRALVSHVVWGNLTVPPMLEGVPMDDVPLPSDPIGQWAPSAEAAAAALESEGAFEAIVHHTLGDINGEILANFRFADHLIHAWDLARAIGADERLDEELVAYCLERTRPLGSLIAATGRFAPAVPVSERADPQVELLALHGRDPRA